MTMSAVFHKGPYLRLVERSRGAAKRARSTSSESRAAKACPGV
jgi:hypothetical protein